ncbi:MAG: hypothetical protein AAF599_14920 [Bacteroidota bacterium]
MQCLLELDQANEHWADLIKLDTQIIKKSKEDPAQAAIEWLNEQTEVAWSSLQNTIFYLTGRAKSIKAFHKALISKGVTSKQIQRMPYWADGKKGL